MFLRKITPPREVAASINAKIQQEQQIQTESFAVSVEEFDVGDAVEAAVLNAIRAGVRDGMAKHGIADIEFHIMGYTSTVFPRTLVADRREIAGSMA